PIASSPRAARDHPGRGCRECSRRRSVGGWSDGSGADDARDAPSLDDQARLARLDRDAIVETIAAAVLADFADVDDFADDTTRRDDLVAALERLQRILMLLPLLLLRTPHDEVDDRDDEDELEHERRERAATGAGGLQKEREGNSQRIDHAAVTGREW